MKEKLKIQRIFMYCHKVWYTDKQGTITGIIEDSPERGVGILVWENEFDASPERRKKLIAMLIKMLDDEGRKYKIYWGQSRV